VEKILRRGLELAPTLNFSSFAFARLDLKASSFESFEIVNGEVFPESQLYDLASLTKPLTLGLTWAKRPEAFSKEDILLLEHRGGLPSWARLSKKSWRDHVLSFPVKESETEYSDLSALRLQLSLETKGVSVYKEAETLWGKDILHWLDLDESEISRCVVTGTRSGKNIQGEVHDDNAFIIKEKCAHAGLFSTIGALARTLLKNFGEGELSHKLMDEFENTAKDQRFIKGWDRVQNLETTLAGTGCSEMTIGHLGFTGTSVWIDLKAGRGHILLSNATERHWYEREKLNYLRRALGQMVWNY
jgi:CubicO group peptidase (beta-lactamase class C family)